ncbi:MAG: branched-chain amino acid ABC transporter permease [Syntrophaceae bacterium]|nr:branched-chain amino acid ABC transporter permease [Syntrophaceae bacterium]
MGIYEQILQFVLTGLTIGAIYALVALGFNIIHNATGIVNFVQCEFVTLGGMMMYTYYSLLGIPLILSFFLSMATIILLGALIERGPIRAARSKAIIVLVFITIGLSSTIRGTALLAWGPDNVPLPSFSGENVIRILGAAILPQHLWIFGITVGVVIFLQYFFHRTLIGKAMRATAVNRKAASLMGISVNRMVLLSFAMSGGIGAVGGMIIAPITTSSYDTGIMLALKGFSAAILGGYGNNAGAVAGGLILGVLESLGAGLISSKFKNAFAFLILLLVLFFKPTGLLGYGESERV